MANQEVRTYRQHLMRLVYVLTFVGVGPRAWSTLVTQATPWDPLRGVAFSFWAAYATLMILGLWNPLKMVPLLLLQLLYKSVWLLAVALPLAKAGPLDATAAQLVRIFVIAVVADLVVIPWPYVIAHYIRKSPA
jgi:NADH:ubiquinone oxidoreductase subunit K